MALRFFYLIFIFLLFNIYSFSYANERLDKQTQIYNETDEFFKLINDIDEKLPMRNSISLFNVNNDKINFKDIIQNHLTSFYFTRNNNKRFKFFINFTKESLNSAEVLSINVKVLDTRKNDNEVESQKINIPIGSLSTLDAQEIYEHIQKFNKLKKYFSDDDLVFEIIMGVMIVICILVFIGLGAFGVIGLGLILAVTGILNLLYMFK